jgi:hypothetical protein
MKQDTRTSPPEVQLGGKHSYACPTCGLRGEAKDARQALEKIASHLERFPSCRDWRGVSRRPR